MEKMPQPQEEFETSFNCEAVAEAAAQTAKAMLAERIDSSLEADERFAEIIALMQDLAEDNGNRFIVEAMAARLSYEKKVFELRTLEDYYPLAVQ
ncbi:hypothetical protein GW766_02450 [Candidatus Parcubacteria bacterium]|nr:hypothetical protein [Candidatus Parcubacteria bacterium]